MYKKPSTPSTAKNKTYPSPYSGAHNKAKYTKQRVTDEAAAKRITIDNDEPHVTPDEKKADQADAIREKRERSTRKPPR